MGEAVADSGIIRRCGFSTIYVQAFSVGKSGIQTLTVNNSFEAVKNRHLFRPDWQTLNCRSITNYEAEGVGGGYGQQGCRVR